MKLESTPQSPQKGKMPVDYKILTDQSSDNLAERVTELLNDGYDLIGGVQVNHVGSNATRYTQSLCKRSESNSPSPKSPTDTQ